MYLLKTFGELTDADVTADPLIMLPCGHLFSTMTLDGHMGMAEAYEVSSSTAAVSGNSSTTAADGGNSSSSESQSCHSDLKPYGTPKHRSDFPQPKHCPNCRGFIAGVRRYGRIVLHSQLGVTQRTYAEAVR
jgi:hypothetical protein